MFITILIETITICLLFVASNGDVVCVCHESPAGSAITRPLNDQSIRNHRKPQTLRRRDY